MSRSLRGAIGPLVGMLQRGGPWALAAAVAVSFALPAAAQVCVGDCGGDGLVTVDEVLVMVNVALGGLGVSSCTAGDASDDGAITVDEILTAVNHALSGCSAVPTPTATVSHNDSYVGDYHGSAPLGGAAVRFYVGADGGAAGFLDLIGSAGSAAGADGGGAGTVLASFPASGDADLTTGAYELSGDLGGSPFEFGGQLPATAGATGTLSVTLFGDTTEGTLSRGTAGPTPTPTPTPGCSTGSLEMSFSTVSSDFNGIASNFVVERMVIALEQPAPDNIPGLNDTYNSTFNGTECTQSGARLRNLQISIFSVLGGLAAGQSFAVGAGSGAGALVYYGEEGSGGDRVWSASTGTVFVDAVDGSVVTLRVVDAILSQPAGAATGSFTLDVSGQVNNFTRQ